MVEPYRLDVSGRGDTLQYRAVLPLRTGYLQRSVLGLALEISLCAVGCPRYRIAGIRWPAIAFVGSVFPRDDGATRYLDGQFPNPLLGKPTICYARQLTE